MNSSNDLSQLLEEASQGDKETTRCFLEAFLSGEVVVPDRKQKQPLSHQPEYPSPLFALLGVKEGERILIPCFTSTVHLLKWTPEPLIFSRVTVKSLLDRTPEGWWLVLNPSDDASKEFSYWEIDKLRGGIQNLDEVISEIFSDAPTRPLEVCALEKGEALELISALREIAQSSSGVERVYILRETSVTAEEESVTSLIVGVLVPGASEDKIAEIDLAFQNTADRAQIGSDRVKIVCGAELGGLALSAFKDMPPIWERKGLLRSLASMFLGR